MQKIAKLRYKILVRNVSFYRIANCQINIEITEIINDTIFTKKEILHKISRLNVNAIPPNSNDATNAIIMNGTVIIASSFRAVDSVISIMPTVAISRMIADNVIVITGIIFFIKVLYHNGLTMSIN